MEKRQPEPKPHVDDIWKDNDPRMNRFVLVLAIDASRVKICRCEADGSAYPRSRASWASMHRFNGSRSGYSFYALVDWV